MWQRPGGFRELAWTQDWSNRPVEADQYFDRVSDAYRAAGDERGLARVSFIRGQVLFRAGQPRQAIENLVVALERYRELDDVPYLSMTLGSGLPDDQGAHGTLSRAYDVRPPVALQLIFEEWDPLQRARALLDPVDFEAALERGRRMQLDEVVELIARLHDEASEHSER